MTLVGETCSEFLWKRIYFCNKTVVFDWIVSGIADLTAEQRDIVSKDSIRFWPFFMLCLFEPPLGFVVDRMTLGQAFFPSALIFPCQYHSTNAPYTFIYRNNW